MTNEQRMTAERHRVREMLAREIEDITEEDGDVRFFGAAFLVAAIQLHAELEGPENLERAITRLGREELQRTGAVKSC